MSEYVWLAALLMGAPVGLVIAHAALTRLLRVRGSSIAPQLVLLAIVTIGNAPVVWLAWEWALKSLCGSAGELVCGVLYVLIAYNGFGFCYFHLLNASETSLHVHILMDLLLEGGFTSAELSQRYNAKDMVSARIERMIALGQLTQKGDCYVLSNGTLLVVGRLINIWRTVLGLPLSPV